MLSHFFYRSFLQYIFCKEEKGNYAEARDLFKKRYSNIWKPSDTGITRNKRSDGSLHEPCATALLATYLNQAMVHCLGNKDIEDLPVWSNEYTLYGSGSINTQANKKQKKTGRGKSPKQPRCDGLMSMPDPLTNDCLRGLVMMEAKIASFTEKDDYQSKSNAVDVMAKQPEGNRPWPLLVFRLTMSQNSSSLTVLAAVPKNENFVELVPMWNGVDEKGGSIFDAVMASVFASIDFRNELIEKRYQLPFCLALRNVAIEDMKDGFVYKSFFETDRRKANLKLIKMFVDSQAEETTLGMDKGSFIMMKYIGEPILPDTEVPASSFVQVAQTLRRAHAEEVCHGDVRLANILLGSSGGVLIDWDLAGKHGNHFYPSGLEKLEDGGRHPDVNNAIDKKKIHTVKLSKEHDWFSMQKVMELFSPKCSSDRVAWKTLIEGIATYKSAAPTFTVCLDPDDKIQE